MTHTITLIPEYPLERGRDQVARPGRRGAQRRRHADAIGRDVRPAGAS